MDIEPGGEPSAARGDHACMATIFGLGGLLLPAGGTVHGVTALEDQGCIGSHKILYHGIVILTNR